MYKNGVAEGSLESNERWNLLDPGGEDKMVAQRIVASGSLRHVRDSGRPGFVEKWT